MGSCCCKNVRVTGIPQQQPIQISNSQEFCKPKTLAVPSLETIEENTSVQEQIHLDSNPTTTQLNHSNEENQPKSFRLSQFPPIEQQTKSNQRVVRLKRQSNRKKPKLTTTNPIVSHDLPSLHRKMPIEHDDQLVESISDENPSTHRIPFGDHYQSLTIDDDDDQFCDHDRFFTSTPIPPSPEQSDSDEEHFQTLKYLLTPLSNHLVSGSSSEEHLTISKKPFYTNSMNTFPIPDLQLSSQYLYSLPPANVHVPMLKIVDNDDDLVEDSLEDSTIYLSNRPTILHRRIETKFELIQSESFNEKFDEVRENVIENKNYRLIIEAWKPNSIEQLSEQINNFAQNKPIIDRIWIIFYWISRNIHFDYVSYLDKKHVDKSPETVFRTRKALSDGYANLFVYLCERIDLICEKIVGYCKTYSFDSSSKTNVPVDHCWNAIQINHFWYFVDLTWANGFFDEKQHFQKQFNSYYFLPKADQMIFHHFPVVQRWQLLKKPIEMSEYMQMPRIWPQFFQFNLQLIDPQDRIHVDFDVRQSYSTVFLKGPSYLNLISSLSLNEKEIDGGTQIRFDPIKQMFHCYFAPICRGIHSIRFFVKNDQQLTTNFYQIVAEFELHITQKPLKTISFPKIWKCFFELNLEIVCPRDTHLIKLDHGDTHTEIAIRAPTDVEIVGRLTIENSMKIPGGHSTYFDRRHGLWKCLFAPPHDGLFEAFILAKRRIDPDGFLVAARFKIRAKRIPNPPISYPKTWQLFYDLDLHIESPKHTSTIPWTEYNSYVQICLRTPDDVQLISCIERNGFRIENGSLAQFNSQKQLWQLFFAPERIGQHKLLVFAHCVTPDGIISGITVEFFLNVTTIRHSMKFPIIYTSFLTRRCRIFEPLDGILKRNSLVTFHCEIPNAKQVDLTIDSKWIKSDGYLNSIFRKEILIGNKEVILYAKYDDTTVYTELIKYIVQ